MVNGGQAFRPPQSGFFHETQADIPSSRMFRVSGSIFFGALDSEFERMSFLLDNRSSGRHDPLPTIRFPAEDLVKFWAPKVLGWDVLKTRYRRLWIPIRTLMGRATAGKESREMSRQIDEEIDRKRREHGYPAALSERERDVLSRYGTVACNDVELSRATDGEFVFSKATFSLETAAELATWVLSDQLAVMVDGRYHVSRLRSKAVPKSQVKTELPKDPVVVSVAVSNNRLVVVPPPMPAAPAEAKVAATATTSAISTAPTTRTPGHILTLLTEVVRGIQELGALGNGFAGELGAVNGVVPLAIAAMKRHGITEQELVIAALAEREQDVRKQQEQLSSARAGLRADIEAALAQRIQELDALKGSLDEEAKKNRVEFERQRQTLQRMEDEALAAMEKAEKARADLQSMKGQMGTVKVMVGDHLVEVPLTAEAIIPHTPATGAQEKLGANERKRAEKYDYCSRRAGRRDRNKPNEDPRRWTPKSK